MNKKKLQRLQHHILEDFINIIQSDVFNNIGTLVRILNETKGIDVIFLHKQSTTHSHFKFTIHKRQSKKIKFYPFTKLPYRLLVKKRSNIIFRNKYKKKKTTLSLLTVLQKLCMVDPKLIIRLESHIFDVKG